MLTVRVEKFVPPVQRGRAQAAVGFLPKDGLIIRTRSVWDWAAVVIVATAACLLAVAVYAQWEFAHTIEVQLVAGSFLVLAGGFVLCDRSISTLKVHVAQPGEPFPVIAAMRMSAAMILCLRATNPQESARLLKYADQHRHSYTRGYVRRMQWANPAPNLLFPRRAPVGFAGDSARREDIWPMARLAIARALYRPKIGAPEGGRLKGDHAYFTYRLHRPSIAAYLALSGTILAWSHLTKDHKLAFSAIWFLWTIWTLYKHRAVGTLWSGFFMDCGNRPLGDLPVFLFCPENSPHSWEELHDADFEAHIGEYLLEASAFFNFCVAVLVAASLGILQLT